jgi:thiosulfate/3-mercaptopyruvate sulfurtransferase
MNAIVTTEGLAAELGAPDLRVVDVRWYLDPQRIGRDAYVAGHIPGAVFLDVATDLSAPGGGRGLPTGRHPWPSEEQVSAVIGAAGIGPATRVVAYDDQSGAIAARLWYLLRAFGHDEVRVLDGGIPKWQAEGRPLEAGIVTVPAAPFAARLRAGWVVGRDEMTGLDPSTLVIDARAGDRYRGETEPIDPRAGHIPGAVNLPFAGNLTSDPIPVLRRADELRARFAAVGADRSLPIVYCGSGVTACHDLLALHAAGLRGRLYAGSWSEWSSDPSLPIATGDKPRS